MTTLHVVDGTLITNGQSVIKSEQLGIGRVHVVTTVRAALHAWFMDGRLGEAKQPGLLAPDGCFTLDAGAKVVAKAYPEEKVGVFALQGGKVSVVEYSELGPKLAAKANDAGELLFNWCGPSAQQAPLFRQHTCRMWRRIWKHRLLTTTTMKHGPSYHDSLCDTLAHQLRTWAGAKLAVTGSLSS